MIEIIHFFLKQCVACFSPECRVDRLDYCAGDADYTSGDHTMCKYCGIGPKCPYHLDPKDNQVTGRVVKEPQTIETILRLHNEIRYNTFRLFPGCQQDTQAKAFSLLRNNNIGPQFLRTFLPCSVFLLQAACLRQVLTGNKFNFNE